MLLLARYAPSAVIIVTLSLLLSVVCLCLPLFSFAFVLFLTEKAINLGGFSLSSRFSSVKVMSEAKVRWIDKFLTHAQILEI